MANIMSVIFCSFFLAFNPFLAAQAKNRSPSFPFITGDGFRYMSCHIYDETQKNLSPKDILEGDIVFLKSDLAREFYEKVHAKIQSHYILISHNSDGCAPCICPELLSDDRILIWFAQNAYVFSDPRVVPIPIGLENRYNRNGNPAIIQEAMKKVGSQSRDIFLYMNFAIGTCPKERSEVFHLLKDLSYCVKGPKPYKDYLDDLSRSVFVVSPRGNGFDCHRTWEALYMGAIPIVKSSAMDSLFEGLPVVIVQDWHEVTENFLQDKYAEILLKEFSQDKIYMNYWSSIINQMKVLYGKNH